MVFVDAQNYLSKQKEKEVYDLHQNCAEDLGYRRFLNKLIEPLTQKLSAGAQGLDFGCGPGPTISVMMAQKNIVVENYDIFYANYPQLLKQSYDFITCTEVVEHLHKPHEIFSLFSSMIKPNGLLGIMTKRVINHESFINWHYKNDPTHVCFYHELSFKYIAEQWGYNLEIINSDTLILKKSGFS
jgi:2-polyprenyl-3-methyl-5-hydroxy-6-metoxy-1,4-benzoquinol methylase